MIDPDHLVRIWRRSIMIVIAFFILLFILYEVFSAMWATLTHLF